MRIVYKGLPAVAVALLLAAAPAVAAVPVDGRGPASGPISWFSGGDSKPRLRGNPLAGRPWFVDYQWSDAWKQARLYARKNPGATVRLRRIAKQPIMKWFGTWDRGLLRKHVREYLVRASHQAPGSIAFIALRRIESANCPYRSPDPRLHGEQAYSEAVKQFALAIGNRRVAIDLEPDQLATIDCLPSEAKQRRLRMIRGAVTILSRLPHATTYIDAGASDWMGWSRMLPYLRSVGISRIRGFALNATHYDWTADNIAYGTQLARRLHTHFIVNTSRNGNGNLPYSLWGRFDPGCNIPNAGLGIPPTVATHNRSIDGFLWLSNPGFSDGNCHGANYRTATVRWDTQLALQLIRRASLRTRGSQITYFH